MSKITVENYPQATVACFDATRGELPRRKLDPETNNRFLEKLAAAGAEAVLIAASTGHGHLRTVEELNDWFLSTRDAAIESVTKMALLRPEDGVAANSGLAQTLAKSGFDVGFVRPGNDLLPDATDRQIADNMLPAIKAVADVGLAVGVYSIPDVSGLPLRPDAVAMILDECQAVVAIKVTESNYEQSTKKFLSDARLNTLKIVQGWDPFLAKALKDDPVRCGVTSGPMSFAIIQYLHILKKAKDNDWEEVELAQHAVTRLFESMQDDPAKFADLQRAKYIMGLGHPISGQIDETQIERVFEALEKVERVEDRSRLAASLNLMGAGPYAERLNELAESHSSN